MVVSDMVRTTHLSSVELQIWIVIIATRHIVMVSVDHRISLPLSSPSQFPFLFHSHHRHSSHFSFLFDLLLSSLSRLLLISSFRSFILTTVLFFRCGDVRRLARESKMYEQSQNRTREKDSETTCSRLSDRSRLRAVDCLHTTNGHANHTSPPSVETHTHRVWFGVLR
jgi:hypothetical protein